MHQYKVMFVISFFWLSLKVLCDYISAFKRGFMAIINKNLSIFIFPLLNETIVFSRKKNHWPL